jgi:hypothetical protein
MEKQLSDHKFPPSYSTQYYSNFYSASLIFMVQPPLLTDRFEVALIFEFDISLDKYVPFTLLGYNGLKKI